MLQAMNKLAKQDIISAIFGSLIVAGAFLAVALYTVHDKQCNQACIAESAEEP
jgi:hypothetical protein